MWQCLGGRAGWSEFRAKQRCWCSGTPILLTWTWLRTSAPVNTLLEANLLHSFRFLPNRDATPQLNLAIWYDDHGSGTFCSPLGGGASAPRRNALLLEVNSAVSGAQVPRLLLSAALGLLLSSAGFLADWPRVGEISFQAPLDQIAGAAGIAQKRLVLWPESTHGFQALWPVKCPKRE